MVYTVLFDEPHEAAWFKNLHPALKNADEIAISDAKGIAAAAGVLSYDRPDIVLLRDGRPILVVEETVEVPSGHNVGQRFARLAAAAEHRVPCLYFGPYKARKHGGQTQGPRYMNLRLFGALDAMTRVTKTALTTINWPVDAACEVRRDRQKDDDVKEYVGTLLDIPADASIAHLNRQMLESKIHIRMLKERGEFAATVKRAKEYDLPPRSVEIVTQKTFFAGYGVNPAAAGIASAELIVYNVGMKKIRSDPYTGMAILYHYLYIAEHSDRALILWFPNITHRMWVTAAANQRRKAIRLFKHAAEGIMFKDGLIARDAL
ncbi:hypothetical protein [Altererythrobacter sp. TH136]|uniref:hypothetical protein n=1 Tax=Altererythrobacter sp. TH136 TaxID=2067415 RepID=UPI0011658877|nr:hypothetical protein [Altererythrobacter sp. TH136]QDM40652.1 hypothetical protein C0V74_06040 [Altererythrobacter sp. TH136]